MVQINAAGEAVTEHITKISQVTPEVTLFLRGLGFSNYYIIKIFDLVGEAAIALTEDNPYWLLDEFSHMGFHKIDVAAAQLGVSRESEYRICSGIRYGLATYMTNGHAYAPLTELCEMVGGVLDLPAEQIRDVAEDMALEGRVQLSTVHGQQVVYFYGYYRAECVVCARLAALEEMAASGQLKAVGANAEALIRQVETQQEIHLSAEQKEAVLGCLTHGVSIITGGPGTGKTTIINAILSILQGAGMKTALAAPTGRAAKRMSEAAGYPASTVHRLLEYYYDESIHTMVFGKNQADPLKEEAIIIDEASMLDLLLMGALCDALQNGSRLILVGDADQLPSVGAGNVLRDLLQSELFFTAKLTEIFRQAAESRIIVNAHRINQGLYPVFGGDFHLLEADRQQEILQGVTELAARFPLEQVQVLTPVKKGIVGSLNLNIHLQQVFNPPRAEAKELRFGQRVYRVGDRVMQIKNDYSLEFRRLNGRNGKGMFNGEIGIVSAIDPDMRTVTVNYEEEKWVEYPYAQLDEIELAYAVTVHKSQGSEFPVVILPMTWFPPALAVRNLLYTAVTRSKREVYIVGRQDYLNAMVDHDSSGKRNSGLCSRLQQMATGI